jgi:hypothetical protein
LSPSGKVTASVSARTEEEEEEEEEQQQQRL